jgi:hypothetical protein
MKITPVATAYLNPNRRQRPPMCYGCELDDPYRFRTSTDYTGGVTITDRRHGYRVYVNPESAHRELQDGECSQSELAAYFSLGATVVNASGRMGFIREGWTFEALS